MASSFRLAIRQDGLRDVEAFARGLGATLEIVMRRLLLQAEREIAMQVKPGMSLNPRSGGFVRAWSKRGGAEVNVTRAGEARVEGRIGSNHPAAKIQEEGGIVVPVRANLLAIPIGGALTRSAVAKVASPLQMPGLVLITSKLGNLLLVKRLSKGRIEPMFALKRSVTLTATRYLTKAAASLDDKAPAIAEAVFAERVPK